MACALWRSSPIHLALRLRYDEVIVEHVDITLPAELKTRAETLARAEGVSLEELIRQSLQDKLVNAPNSQPDPFFDYHETFDGDVPSDLAANHDKYLYDE